MIVELMEPVFTIEPVHRIGPDLRELVSTAVAEGHGFMQRLIETWESGTNRFDRAGEAYFGVWQDGHLVAAGGLNRDPYCSDPAVGRVRHVYVDPAMRRSGAGTVLMDRIVATARPNFTLLRLKTNTPRGAAFYEALGFVRSADSDASHVMPL